MKSKQIDEQVIQKVYQVLDKLEQRIATLEKVLESHEGNNAWNTLQEAEEVKQQTNQERK